MARACAQTRDGDWGLLSILALTVLLGPWVSIQGLTSHLCLIAELNVGGIVAAVLVTLILLGVLIFGIWFAYSRGYFDSKYLPSKALPPRAWLLVPPEY